MLQCCRRNRTCEDLTFATSPRPGERAKCSAWAKCLAKAGRLRSSPTPLTWCKTRRESRTSSRDRCSRRTRALKRRALLHHDLHKIAGLQPIFLAQSIEHAEAFGRPVSYRHPPAEFLDRVTTLD